MQVDAEGGGGFADKPTLRGGLVELRPFADADIAAMAAILAEPEVIRLTGSAHSSADIIEKIAEQDRGLLERWYGSRAEQTDRLDLAIVDLATGVVVGEVVLNEYDAANQACNYRILIGAAGQGRGLGTEAGRLVIDYAFSRLPLHRIGLEVYSFNPRARRSYQKIGFVHEGSKRDALLFDGQWFDAEVMAILFSDWLASRQSA